MKTKAFIWLLVSSSILSNIIDGQIITSKKHPSGLSDISLTVGAGYNTKGFMTGINNTYGFSGSWGVTLCYDIVLDQVTNLPKDFYSSNFNIIPPSNVIHMVSLRCLKEFPDKNRKFMLGVECGPAWYYYKVINFNVNPDYYVWNFFTNKYLKSKTFYSSIGLSTNLSAKYHLTEDFALELTFPLNINSFEQIAGVEFCIKYGLAGKDQGHYGY